MEGVRCDLDVEFADQIDALLSPPTPEAVKEYYDDVIKRREPCAIEVKQEGKLGKGVYATKEYNEEELILRDKMLVAAQHCANKIDCLVCSYCFSYIGSIELQIGRKLYLRSLKSTSYLADGGTISDVSDDVCPVDLMESEENPLPRSCIKMNSSSPKDLTFNNSCVNEKDLVSLMDRSLTLPHSYQFPLPSVISCPGGCEEEHYCSDLCAKKDWETCHSLLCTGERSESTAIEALVKFMEHANRTNDIFILAAKAISYTILKYRRLKSIHLKGKEPMNGSSGKDTSSFPLLLDAWRPISMGFHKRWWDCVALPDDVDHLNEGSFRMQIKQLAFESLQLLKEAIFDKECAPLFSLEIYGHIIGMFELNNLDLVVASPVEDYFLYIDDLPPPEKEKAEMLTGQFLDALGESYSDCCEGTAFFPLQSCMNHSCCPNAKAFKRDEDRDGHAIILASKPISKGEEITVSYIDEGLPYKERHALLADYGFTCRCSKCLEEEKEE